MIQRFSLFFVILFSLLLVACSNDEIDSNVISNGSTMSPEAKEEEKDLDKVSYSDLLDVFLDTNKIDFNKNVLIIFGRNNCSYCDMIKDLIKQDDDLKQLIKDNFNPYYINISYSKIHEINFNDRQSKIDTNSIASLFSVNFTPTIVFLGKDGTVWYLFPGFTPKFKDLVLEVIKKNAPMGEYEDLNNKIRNI